MNKQPNILFIMCDQFRFDCISALGNNIIRTPNLDRLVHRGISFTNAYSTNPVCIAARYTLMTGREPYHTGSYFNEIPSPMDGLAKNIEDRCGKYIAGTLGDLGYRTFGMGKFHVGESARDKLGFDTKISVEELFTSDTIKDDDYAMFMKNEHPEYSHIEQLHGERSDMYYVPQTRPFPAELTGEAFTVGKGLDEINRDDGRPYFGYISFIGPHPPVTPPIPYNRMYNPDIMPNPIRGDLNIDMMDEYVRWMNHAIWAEDINDFLARRIKSHYYGEISFIDDCIGQILDLVESRADSDNTLICFFSDHGDHMGDHNLWQKESYFEESCRIPYLVSWPERLEKNAKCDELVAISDLFAIATCAAGSIELRDGTDVLDMLRGSASPRKYLYACYGRPGTPLFKCMVRYKEWKYIFLSNGGREQLFNLDNDPHEMTLRNNDSSEIFEKLKTYATEYSKRPGLYSALDGDKLKVYDFKRIEEQRILQFAYDRGVTDFTVGACRGKTLNNVEQT